ncbi:DUF3556 domain-containing protein [Pimelobacter simplex]|uniref:Conserved membrane protein n=1 Tax=Nocardioides simplex TaxID=2045 RepID=A0A0A1DIA1_NOCSI|nr:DUF3556 domain-containing protein [Pimelobacter simplex]AIY16372.1 Conserved membrane protein [Pimelobacter simplex]MCG8152966.1 DUF3556 domain-containing protein [Pimelobacter simplex]GEB11933.1 membrane protein [Pimelobacter simplex]SFN03510.1 Transmembrane protein of unknown function [Pimelobacter simplex]
MGFLKPAPEPMPPAEFLVLPLRERIRVLSTNWVTAGFNTPRMLHVVYILKMLGLYFAVGLAITSATTDHVAFTDPGTWFDNVVVYQKLAIWLMLLEVIGLGGAFGPLCGHFVPMLGNIRYWLRPGTIRMAPWGRHVPLTGGDERTIADVLLYVAVLASLCYPLLVHADPVPLLPAGTGPQELVPPLAFVPILVTMPLMGLRDKVVFLAARSEQYLPVMLFSATFGAIVLADGASAADFVNLVVAFKIIICVVWIGAGVSKLGEHFINVVPPMVSNSPGQLDVVKRLHYRNAPDDIRPSRLAWFMAHVGGTTVEIIIPVVLLLTTNDTIALLGAVAMLVFHVYITSTFPLAVPLEWNVYFGYIAIVLWAGLGDGFHASTYNIWEFSEPLLLIPVFALLLFGPVLGNLRPDLVSFLPSMRQYAGNWASAVWTMRPGIEERFNELPLVENQVDQLQRMQPMPYAADEAEMTIQKALAWRSMHSQGRGLFSVLYEHLDDIETRAVREGEFVCNTVVGWNFGDGHLHDERLVAAIQKRLQLAPGDLVVAYCESQATPWRTSRPQEYRVIDAALGVVERGTWDVRDCVREQPWLPNGPVPLQVTWTAEGYRRQSTLTDGKDPVS